MPYKISFEANPKSEEIAILQRGIADDNAEKGIKENAAERFAFFIRDDNNQIIGGCDGEIWEGCMHIHHLWVDEGMRGSGYGAKLMLSAENYGAEKGCTFASAYTMMPDVVSFYKELGYAIEFERKGYLKNSVLYFMRRDLAGLGR